MVRNTSFILHRLIYVDFSIILAKSLEEQYLLKVQKSKIVNLKSLIP